MPRRRMRVMPIYLREAQVSRVIDLSPCMRRVTLTGPELAGARRDGHEVEAFRSEGFDDHIKMVFGTTDPGRQEATTVDWSPGALHASRDYTVRRWDAERGELDVDIVRHATGLAASWVETAAPGTSITFAGPKSSALMPTDCDWQLLFGDETALPAICRWLSEAAPGTRARIFIEVPAEADAIAAPTAAEAEITWLIRGQETAPGRSSALLDAIRDWEFWPGEPFVWGAGESLSLIPIRRHLRRDRGLHRDQLDIVGYWRRTAEAEASSAPAAEQPAGDADGTPAAGLTAGNDRAAADGPAAADGRTAGGGQTAGDGSAAASTPAAVPASPMDQLHTLHELGELAPPLILRAFVTLDMPDILSEEPQPLDALAAAAGIDPDPLFRLLRASTALGLTAIEQPSDGQPSDGQPADGPARLRLTGLGLQLTDEDIAAAYDLRTPGAAAELSLFGLLEALSTGQAQSPSVQTGSSIPAGLRTDPAYAGAVHEEAAESARLFAEPLAGLPDAAQAGSIALCGPGVREIAVELREACPQAQLHICGRAAETAWLGTDSSLIGTADTESGIRLHTIDPADQPSLPSVDTTVLVHELCGLPDAQAEALLAAALRASTTSVIVLERTADDALSDDHLAAADLLALTSRGGRLRTSGQITALAAAAQATVEHLPLGWSFIASAFRIVPQAPAAGSSRT